MIQSSIEKIFYKKLILLHTYNIRCSFKCILKVGVETCVFRATGGRGGGVSGRPQARQAEQGPASTEGSRFISLRVEVSLFVLSPEIEDRDEVDVGNLANKMQELCH
jgi:hypothetical protein